MLASGCGKALVGVHGILFQGSSDCFVLTTRIVYVRERHVKRDAEFLSNMDVRKAWGVCDDGISHKGRVVSVSRQILMRVEDSTSSMRFRCRAKPVASLNA